MAHKVYECVEFTNGLGDAQLQASQDDQNRAEQ